MSDSLAHWLIVSGSLCLTLWLTASGIGGCPSAGHTRNSKSFERAHKSMSALPVSLVSPPKRPAVPTLAPSRAGSGGGGGADGNEQWANCKFGRAMHEPVSLGDAVEFVARTQRNSTI